MRGVLLNEGLGDVGHHGFGVFRIKPGVTINDIEAASLPNMPAIAFEGRPPPHRQEL
jgi:hypothetical protein